MYNMRQRINDNLERSMGQLQDAPPGVHIERSEQRAPGSYRWGACCRATAPHPWRRVSSTAPCPSVPPPTPCPRPSPLRTRFYESISIRSGVSVASVPTTPLAPAHALGPSPLLIAAMVLAGAGAAVAAAFNRNFDCTTYSRKSRVELTLLLPFLAAFSKRFRQQLASALRGVPYEVTEDGRLAPPAQQHRMQQGGQPASRRAAASTENEMKA